LVNKGAGYAREVDIEQRYARARDIGCPCIRLFFKNIAHPGTTDVPGKELGCGAVHETAFEDGM
jgi:hypothetical protein